jgi:MFS family permease
MLCAYVFYSYAWNTVDFLRPFWRTAYGLSLVETGFIYTAQSLGALMGAIVLAQLADRYGRRNVLAVMNAAIGLCMIAGIWVTGLPGLLLQRCLLGFFMGGMFACVVGIYVGLYEQRLRGRLASLVAVSFGAGNVLLPWVASIVLVRDWTLVLLLGGVPSLVLAAAAWLLLPDDRALTRPAPAQTSGKASSLPFAELFKPQFRRTTLKIVALSGLNFFAYQAFTGWVTTYLLEERNFTPVAMSSILMWQTAAALAGSLFWGWVADRFGRRISAAGFFVGALMIGLYLFVPADPTLLSVIGATYGFMISASVAWGVWFTELYPDHLRSTAASLMHYGRIVTFLSPPLIALVANSYGLGVGMMLAGAAFLVAGAVWLAIPETLNKGSEK